jgi:hypothetical protein
MKNQKKTRSKRGEEKKRKEFRPTASSVPLCAQAVLSSLPSPRRPHLSAPPFSPPFHLVGAAIKKKSERKSHGKN